MDTFHYSFSIVLAAENNNPTILNPDFLVRNKIIPEDWLIDQNTPVLTTPVFSQCSFLSGISFRLEPERLTIRDLAPGGGTFPVPEIAIKYINTIPHVRYSAIGINFEKILVFNNSDEAKSFQKQKFLKDGPWDMGGSLSEFSSKFVYSLSDSQCNITFSSPLKLKVKSLGEEPKDMLILAANFHRDFKSIQEHDQRNTQIIKVISDWELDKKTFELITNKLTGEK